MDTNTTAIIDGLTSGWASMTGLIIAIVTFSLGVWLVKKVRMAGR